MSSYSEFLAKRAALSPLEGLPCTAGEVHPFLYDWQREVVAWAVRTGRCALWEDTGLGKTAQQLEWLRLMIGDGIGLIVAPLAVCAQTVREAAKVDIKAEYIREQPSSSGIYVTNYEMVEHIEPSTLAAVVLDEASILKQSTGITRTMLIKHFADVPYRLACTATPAPNDPEELTNQAEFLGRMTRVNMLAAYFIHDSDGWRMKKHARLPMMEWMASWAMALRRPSDLGDYDDTGYDLPGLTLVSHLIEVEMQVEGQLFATELGGVSGRAQVRRATIEQRCAKAAELVAAEPDESWLLWCGMNAEAELLAKLTGGTNIHGSLSPEEKAKGLLGFSDGDIQILVTKPEIASQGLNYQHCARMAFVGLSDSYEQYYQAIRRCYRYGQTRVVDAHIILSQLEGQIANNVARKEREAGLVTAQLVAAMNTARRVAA